MQKPDYDSKNDCHQSDKTCLHQQSLLIDRLFFDFFVNKRKLIVILLLHDFLFSACIYTRISENRTSNHYKMNHIRLQ